MGKFISGFSFLFRTLGRSNAVCLWLGLFHTLACTAKGWWTIFCTGFILDSLAKGRIRDSLLLAAVMLVCLLCMEILRTVLESSQHIAYQKVDEYLNVSIYKKMLRLPYSELIRAETKEKHEFARIVLKEIGIDVVYYDLYAIVLSVINLACGATAVFFMERYMFLAVLLVLAVNAASEIYKMNCKYAVDQEVAGVELNLYYARDYLATPKFAKEIRLFQLIPFVSGKVSRFIDELCGIKIQAEKKHRKRFWIVYLLDAAIVILVYFQGSLHFRAGKLEIGAFSVYLSSMMLMVGALSDMVGRSVALAGNLRYICAMKDFLETGEDGEEAKPRKIEACRGIAGLSGYAVEFRDVSFKYEDEYIIRNVSFQAVQQERIAIVGQNGAGKTTLMLLLLGFLKPTSGEILVNGKPQDEYGRKEYMDLFSAVLQDFNLYAFSVGENVAMGKDMEEEKFWECLGLLDMEKKIRSLPEEEETYMGQRYSDMGEELSGGEQQKLAIARALYKNAAIMVFDEPTSALSPQSEFEIYKKFGEISQGRTVFFISHRLASCRLCDRIMVLDRGRIIESGSHEQLMGNKGLYHSLFTLQLEGFQKDRNEENEEDK